MEWIPGILIGAVVGIGAAFLWRRFGSRTGETSTHDADSAVLQERLNASESRTAELKSAVERLTDESNKQRQSLNEEMTRRAAAEEKASRLDESESELKVARESVGDLRAKCSELETSLEKEREAAAEKLAAFEAAQVQLANTFKALASDALEKNRESFLDLAQAKLEKFQESARGDLGERQKAIHQLVKPLNENLTKVTGKIEALEKDRTHSFATLQEQLSQLSNVHGKLEQETRNLVKALRQPAARGRWGEIQLQRVVEMAGMIEHCDFELQESVNTEAGRLRPDMVIKLPGGKNIVVDSKVALDAYLTALEMTDDESRAAKMRQHADQVRDHMKKLGAKSYWQHLDPTPEFVVLFLPGEPFFSAALEQQPDLIEMGVKEKVIIATPTTLIALLRAVAYGWDQERLTRNAEEISNLGRQLYDRIRTLAEHFTDMGSKLEKATESYNKAVGSLESRVLTTARRFKELGTGSEKEIVEPDPIETRTRNLERSDYLRLVAPDEEGPDVHKDAGG